jgi:hypothetical protein
MPPNLEQALTSPNISLKVLLRKRRNAHGKNEGETRGQRQKFQGIAVQGEKKGAESW